ncbi:MAG: leucine-rich repeat protein [Rikenellaceae bacterium]
MKQISNFFLVLCALLFTATSCQESEPTVDPTLEVTPLELAYTAEGGDNAINVESNTDWSISSTADWIFLPYSTGSGNLSVTVTAIENTSSDSRTATITITTGNLSQSVAVSQEGTGGSDDPSTGNLTLKTIDPESLPAEDTWVLYDTEATSGVRRSFESNATGEITSATEQYGDFGDLFLALENAAAEGRSISISFPYLTNLPEGAFYDTFEQKAPSALVSVSIPITKSVGDFAFCDNTNVTKFSLGVAQTVGAMALANCSSATTIDVEDMTSAGYGAFLNCSELTTVICWNLTTIGAECFSGATNLLQFGAPYLAYIGSGAFKNINAMTDIQVGSYTSSFTVEDGTIFDGSDLSGTNLYTSYGEMTSDNYWMVNDYEFGPFGYIEGIEEMFEPLYLTTIDPENIPSYDTWEILDDSAATGVKPLTYDAAGYVTGYKDEDGDFANLHSALLAAGQQGREISLVFPNMTTLPDAAFYDPSLVDLPSGEQAVFPTALVSFEAYVISEIGEEAFAYCTGLRSVSILSLKTIKDYGFYECESLTNLNMSKLTTVGDYALAGLSSFTSISFDNVTTLGVGALSANDKLTSITLPLLSQVGSAAFSDNASLATLNIATLNLGLDFDSDNAFADTDLSKVTLTTYNGTVADDYYWSVGEFKFGPFAQIKGITESGSSGNEPFDKGDGF